MQTKSLGISILGIGILKVCPKFVILSVLTWSFRIWRKVPPEMYSGENDNSMCIM